MHIRPATLHDVPTLVELGRAMHAESPRFRRLSFDGVKVRQTLSALIRASHGFVYVAEEGERVVGAMAAYALPEWHSVEVVAHDLAVFVEPTARGSAAAGALLLEFQEWAQEQGAVFATAGISTGVAVQQTAALYERLGATVVGPIFEFNTSGA